MKKVTIIRVLNLDGTWQGYRLTPINAYGTETWKNPGKKFKTLEEIIAYYNLSNVRELGTRYSYDNKGQKYGCEEHLAIL